MANGSDRGHKAVRQAVAKTKASDLVGRKKHVGVRCPHCYRIKRLEMREVDGVVRLYGAFDLTNPAAG